MVDTNPTSPNVSNGEGSQNTAFNDTRLEGPTIVTSINPEQELCRSFKTITEMLRDRGSPSELFESLTSDAVIQSASGRPVFFLDDESIGYRIVYDMTDKFRFPTVKKILTSLPEEVKHVIIVVRKWASNSSTTSASVEKYIKSLGIQVHFFELCRLQFNITRHFLVPKHEPIRDEEAIEGLISKYMLKSRFMMPIIFDKDPVAQYLGLRHGQLVKITRNSPTAGTHVLYRCCCAKTDK